MPEPPLPLDVWLEPIVAVHDQSVAARELLIRPVDGGSLRAWATASRTEVGRITDLALRAARTALDRTSGVVHVNVTPTDLHDPGFGDAVLHAFTRRLAPRLVLEVVEDEQLEDRPEVARTLARLRQPGIRFALDDFGDGCADERSAAILRPEVIKVRLDRALDRTVHARLLHLTERDRPAVVVEQVETEAHLRSVRAMGFSHAQGWLWGPSRAANDLLAPVDRRRRQRAGR